jgi:DNA-binding MarR family transcriptional regulator
MSTLLTIADEAVTLPLGQHLIKAQQWVSAGVLDLMAKRGHKRLAPSHLAFLANLDCGSTHASAVARRMGVSRQAVYRTTRELQAMKILDLVDDPDKKNQKIIRMTAHGTKVVADARLCLAKVEATLRERLGARNFDRLSSILRADWGSPL